MKPGLPFVGILLSATICLNAQNMPAPRTLEEFDALFTKIFQTTFRDSLHSSGTPRSAECP